MSRGGKYAFATVMSMVLPMCILTSCSSVLCVLMALGMFMFVKVMISVMSPLLVVGHNLTLFYDLSSIFIGFVHLKCPHFRHKIC